MFGEDGRSLSPGVTSEQRAESSDCTRHGTIWRKSIPGGRNSKCEASEQDREGTAHGSLASLRLTDQPREFMVRRASQKKKLIERNVYRRQ